MSNLIGGHHRTSFKNYSMGYTLEAVFNKELVEVAVFVHIEISRVDLSEDVPNLILLGLESLLFSKFEDGFLEVMVGWKHNY